MEKLDEVQFRETWARIKFRDDDGNVWTVMALLGTVRVEGGEAELSLNEETIRQWGFKMTSFELVVQ